MLFSTKFCHIYSKCISFSISSIGIITVITVSSSASSDGLLLHIHTLATAGSSTGEGHKVTAVFYDISTCNPPLHHLRWEFIFVAQVSETHDIVFCLAILHQAQGRQDTNLKSLCKLIIAFLISSILLCNDFAMDILRSEKTNEKRIDKEYNRYLQIRSHNYQSGMELFQHLSCKTWSLCVFLQGYLNVCQQFCIA